PLRVPRAARSSCSVQARALPSFPTRRSSDLEGGGAGGAGGPGGGGFGAMFGGGGNRTGSQNDGPAIRRIYVLDKEHSLPGRPVRSEEHTSELQSPCNLVCRLLLEKKKDNRLR